jgi:hypothetical protein
MGFLDFGVAQNRGLWGRKLRFCKFLHFFAFMGCFLVKVRLFLMKVVLFFALFKIFVLAGAGAEFF